MGDGSTFQNGDRLLLQRIDERQKALQTNLEKIERRVGRIEIVIGSMVIFVAGYGLKIILAGAGLPTP